MRMSPFSGEGNLSRPEIDVQIETAKEVEAEQAVQMDGRGQRVSENGKLPSFLSECPQDIHRKPGDGHCATCRGDLHLCRCQSRIVACGQQNARIHEGP